MTFGDFLGMGLVIWALLPSGVGGATPVLRDILLELQRIRAVLEAKK